MSDASLLEATVRTEFGKGAARRTRRSGNVPAVVYGHGEAPRHVSINARAFAAVLRSAGANAVLNLSIDGEKQLVMTKSIAVHPVRRYIEHADLLLVKRGEKVTAEVHLELTGEAAPGTLVTQEGNTISVAAEALRMPQQVEVSVAGAEPGTQITAGQIPLPPGVTLVGDPEHLIVNIIAAPAAETTGEQAEAGEAPAE